ncbi:MAG: hypothetical protein M3O46_23495 [Myxococcota bacterium]|nr:hypothetical protein [Myxococcota bacterium]
MNAITRGAIALIARLVAMAPRCGPERTSEGRGCCADTRVCTMCKRAMARYACQWLDDRGALWDFYRAWRDGVMRDPS